jgi:hypothetical protein
MELIENLASKYEWAWSTTDLALIDSFERVLHSMVFSEHRFTKAGLLKFIDRFMECIPYKTNPNDYCPFINNGAYKEVYETGMSGWVIKFCSGTNATKTEEALTNAAHQYHIGRLFPESYYLYLPFYLDSTHIDADETPETYNSETGQYEYDLDAEYVPHWFDACIIQRECHAAEEAGYELLDEYTYDSRPLVSDAGYEHLYEDVAQFKIADLTWLRSVICYHGDDVFNRLWHFIQRFQLCDLHPGNIGYDCNGHPVIFDWLSADSIEESA